MVGKSFIGLAPGLFVGDSGSRLLLYDVCAFLRRHDIQHNDSQHNDIQRNNKENATLSKMSLNKMAVHCQAERCLC